MPEVTVRHSDKKSELFSVDKLRASILSAALANSVPEGQATQIADTVTKNVDKWLKGRAVVTPKDIRRVAAQTIEPLHPGLAFFYAHGDRII
ncbi:MAG: hypothetical protein LBG75_00730 [Candidatus Nomurabacteria bacterium]|jgi:transcriptional regulator NrdR family protein|nr:hypothetical protein [Candidatus Nomurabacteria bacterium]